MREYRCICNALRHLQGYDQVDAANSAAAEFLTRRLMQIEAATRRNPRQPDFEGLDGILDVALDKGGSAILPRFTEWVGDQQQAEASILKAGRQWREEQTSIKKSSRPPRGTAKTKRHLDDPLGRQLVSASPVAARALLLWLSSPAILRYPSSFSTVQTSVSRAPFWFAGHNIRSERHFAAWSRQAVRRPISVTGAVPPTS